MNFNYRIVRSKRKTMSVSVSAENVVTVRCPLLKSDKDVEAFVKSKSGWISKILAKNNANRAGNEGVLNYSEVFIGGKKYPVVYCDKNKIEGGTVYVKNVASIKKTLVKYLAEDLINFAEQISAQIKLQATGFSIKSYKSRWGCCDKKGSITLSCYLIMLPLRVQRYVIIHELCHTVHFDHSKKFWELVAKFEPEYKLCRKNLRSYDYLIKIY